MWTYSTPMLVFPTRWTSSSVHHRANSRCGGRLQQLGIHIWEMVVPLVAIDGVRPCLPKWCGYTLPHGLSVQTGDALSVNPFSWPWGSWLLVTSHPPCVLSLLHHTPYKFHIYVHLRAVSALNGVYYMLPHLVVAIRSTEDDVWLDIEINLLVYIISFSPYS